MCISSVEEAQGDVLVFSDTEANLEFGEGTNHELVASRMSLTTSWVGQTVCTRCREVNGEEEGVSVYA